MDNYKIKVKDEAESKEAQELFFELGYEKSKQCQWLVDSCIQFLATDGDFLHCWDDEKFGGNRFEILAHKELTLPQLRDLVVLKRGDVRDATHVDPGGTKHVEIDGRWYWFHEESTPDIQFGWVESAAYREYDDNVLKPITQPQDPALISGAEAKLAWANGESVQFRDEFDKWYEDWTDLNSKKNGFWITDFDSPHHQFRIKPTLTVNAELPKLHKETQHNSLVYAVTYEFKTREERNAFADKLRGTNS